MIKVYVVDTSEKMHISTDEKALEAVVDGLNRIYADYYTVELGEQHIREIVRVAREAGMEI
jgi:hypothetical protein